MAIPTIAWLIENRLTPKHTEAETSRVWDDILHDYFKSAEGYSTGPEMQFGSGRADLFTAHIVLEGRAQERKFLIVECKHPGDETQPNVWTTGVRQLRNYLETIPTSRHRKFGAIAVGKTVRFYEWVDRTLVDFDNNGSIYYIDRQCQDVTRVLEVIKSTT